MKRLPAILLACALLSLTGCKSRVNTPSSSSEPSSSLPPSSSAAQSVSPELPSSSSEPERSAVSDADQVTQAEEIVQALLDQAATADEIYRAALKRDSAMEPISLEDKEYYAVTDERFVTIDDITDLWNQTFTKGGKASDAFSELQDNKVYVSMNGELYMLTEQRQLPLTMGAWKTETMELLLMDEQQIECRMETTLLGKPEGEKLLRIVRDGDNWLLGDSYFLD